jgi:hypothetical protein
VAGFANWREYGDAFLSGARSYTSYRKTPSQATVAGWWVDLSMSSGNPPPNYYASAPLVAATLDGLRGMNHGSDKSPAYTYLQRLSLCTPTAAFVGRYVLLDYCLYYPFIDGDDGDIQIMDNTVTLPRYTSGAGVQAMLVAAAPTTGGGTFTFDYINQDGVSKTSPIISYTTASAGITSIATSQPAVAAGMGPFLRLADGDTGIRSVTSFQNIVLNGGLTSLVLVKPIVDAAIYEINTCSEFEYGGLRPMSQRIEDGAYLNFIMNCAATVAAGTLTAHATFVWG